jgi:hypothetical protein
MDGSGGEGLGEGIRERMVVNDIRGRFPFNPPLEWDDGSMRGGGQGGEEVGNLQGMERRKMVLRVGCGFEDCFFLSSGSCRKLGLGDLMGIFIKKVCVRPFYGDCILLKLFISGPPVFSLDIVNAI